ncbi:MAG TPA: glycosyltransferase family 2 protein [Egibacteraceae bacterium]|nr:glycosyltransferase family 2 protein [Egibacteraceae bacterium]HVM14600.1 glycosyltransferase family 2 protein [Egibacteraceae bacterium]HVM21409.1 glycosyltransferase family 2 protein [Egibacteraceae bacterium]
MNVVDAAAVAGVALAAHTARNARRLRTPPPAPTGGFVPLVSVLIPARDEGRSIAACIEAVLQSRGVVLEVIVLDDGSSDDTAAVVEKVAAADRRVTLLRGAQLPPGWLGKPFACHQLAAAARGRILAFLDADVIVAEDGLARTAALLDTASLDLVSPYPRQTAVTVAERLVQPLLQWSWLTFLPLRLAERSPRPSLTAANGQLLVCRADAYRSAGGHASVAAEVIEDVALARAFKRHGSRVTVADGTTVASCRMYGGWRELRDGYTKSLWSITRRPWGGAGIVGGLLLLYVAPPVAAVWRVAGRRPGAATAALGYAAGVTSRVIAARRTGGRPTDASAHPLSIAVLAWLWGRSIWAWRTGRLQWKGRTL